VTQPARLDAHAYLTRLGRWHLALDQLERPPGAGHLDCTHLCHSILL
jgi:hypothetical protein